MRPARSSANDVLSERLIRAAGHGRSPNLFAVDPPSAPRGVGTLSLTTKGKQSLAAAVLGLISFLLPWMTIIVSSSTAYGISGESSADLLGSFLAPHGGSVSTDPGLAAWEYNAVFGFSLWTIGSVIFIMGILTLVIQAFSSMRWAGLELAIGTAVSGIGILSFSYSFPYKGYTATVIPSIGLILGIVASIVGVLPLYRVEPEDEWKQVSLYPPYRDIYPDHPAVDDSTATSSEPSAVQGTATGTSGAPVNRPPGAPWFCPECGHWYYGDAITCPEDGARLNPVRHLPS